jgi:NAD+ synthase
MGCGYSIIPPIDCHKVEKRICSFIKDTIKSAGARGAVIGLSGGLDSSVTAYLLARSIGPGNVKALIMPDSRITPKSDTKDAWTVAEELDIESREVDIATICNSIIKSHPYGSESHLTAAGNVRARVRMVLLYYAANTMNMLVCGTSDKSEIMIGYFTKYGDGGADFLPIGDLYKTDVRRLARHLGVPEKIASKPSSPRLWPGQTAEGELGLSYEIVDCILYLVYERNLSAEEAAVKLNLKTETANTIIRRVEGSKHKRSTPPFPAVSYLRVASDSLSS